MAARRLPGGGRQVAVARRKRRSPKYSYDAVKVLQRVWAASGGQCGKYLAASSCRCIDATESLWPARFDGGTGGNVQEAVLTVQKALGLSDLSHTYTIVDRRGTRVVNVLKEFETSEDRMTLR
jgi:hypothetical protein